MTLVVKGMGFGKELVVADKFGTGDALDAFLLAFLIPMLIANILAGGLDALTPAVAHRSERSGASSAHRLALSGLGFFATLLGGFLLLGYFFKDPLLRLVAMKFAPNKQSLAAELFGQLTAFGFFYGIAQYLVAWLYANKRFLIASASPALVPLSTMAVLIFSSPSHGIQNLVNGTIWGSFLMCSVLGFTVWGMWRRDKAPVKETRDGELLKMLSHAAPLLIGGLLANGMPLVDSTMAGMLEAGSVSVLSYAEKVSSIGLALFATSIGQVIYPHLAQMAARRSWLELSGTVRQFIGIIGGASVLIVILVWLAAPWLVSLLFERGEFRTEDSERVVAVLRCQILQIPFYIAAVLASQVVNALRAGKFMLFTTIVTLAANIWLNLLLMQVMGLPGIALATAGVYLVSAILLCSFIQRRTTALAREDELNRSTISTKS
jgi:putative peptidoglycan lipid II flippase